MPTHKIPYKETGYFSELICDYLDQSEKLSQFYDHFPSLDNFKYQIEEERKNFPSKKRRLLAKRIMHQYRDNSLSQSTLSNIDLLKEATTFTVTTGHQLNIFTGPLYFLYKIFSTINLCEQLKEAYPNNHFVPIYWMATEDHDFEEINHFELFGEKISWDREASGAVGELSTDGLEVIKNQLENQFGTSENGMALTALFSEAYTKHKNLADATRYLTNKLFFQQGLVILDGNDPELKACFVPFAEKELTENLSYKKVSATTQKLVDLGYPEQVHPREINLFYLKKNLRERIIERNGTFFVDNTEISFSKEEILKELNEHPERFSPNALLRPVYEEVILPNLCYIGGGAEVAYWFQLKEYFQAVKVPFPILLLRNSALLVPRSISKRMEKHQIKIEDLFLPQNLLMAKHTHEISKFPISFAKQKNYLQKQFQDLYKIAEKTDKSFLGAVAAQEKKQLNGLDNLEKRLLRAQKRKHSEQLDRVRTIQDQLFPNQILQERKHNFSEYYLENGVGLLETLKKGLDPLDFSFSIFELD